MRKALNRFKIAFVLTLCMALITAGPASAAGTFIISGPANITQWDPLNETRLNMIMQNMLLYDFLVRPSVDLVTMEPMLAESWSVSDDGLEWTFKLRQGVKFHNGEEFDSASVVTTFQRLIDDKTLARATLWGLLESVRAVDKHTAVIRLSAPWGAMFAELVSTPMLPPKMYEEMGEDMFIWDDTNKPVGTGPWIADVWMPGQDAAYVRNDDYWGWGGNKSTYDRFIYRPIAEDTSRVAGIQTGDLTMVTNIPDELSQTLEGVEGVTVERIPTNSIIHLGFRTSEEDGKYRVFKDINARKAVMHALDVHGIVNAIAGGGTPSNWPAPKGVVGHDESRAFEWKYDPALAKELLAQSDYDGQPIVFMVPNGVFARSNEIAQAINAMLTAAGFTVDLQFMEDAAFQAQRAAGAYDLYIQRYRFNVGDPDANITMRWLNDAHKSGYVNEKMNELIRASKVETDAAKREQILKDMFFIQWNELAPHAAVFSQVSIAAYQNGVSGLRLRYDDTIDFSRVTFIP